MISFSYPSQLLTYSCTTSVIIRIKPFTLCLELSLKPDWLQKEFFLNKFISMLKFMSKYYPRRELHKLVTLIKS